MPTTVRKDLEPNLAVLAITLLRDDFKPQLDSELKKFRQKAQIKGFRIGQVPMTYVKQMYGQSILADIINKALSKELQDYLSNSGMRLLGEPLPMEDQPKLNLKIDNPDPEYTFYFEVGHIPDWEIKGLDGSEHFERLTISELDKLVDDDMLHARKQVGKSTNPSDDIQDNDMVRIQATEVDGDYECEFSVLPNAMPDNALKAEILTKKMGDSITFNSRDVDKFEDEEKYRKYILRLDADDARVVGDMFAGTITEVSRTRIAEMDAEFFEDYFGPEVTTEEEARESIKRGLLSFYDARSNGMLMRDFQERLMQLNPINLPENFLKRWVKTNNEEATDEIIENEFGFLIDNIRWSLIRNHIIDANNIQATEQEVAEAFANRVREYYKINLPDNLMQKMMEAVMKDKKQVEEIEQQIEADKIFQAVRAQMQVTDKMVTTEEFHAILDAIRK